MCSMCLTYVSVLLICSFLMSLNVMVYRCLCVICFSNVFEFEFQCVNMMFDVLVLFDGRAKSIKYDGHI